MKNWHLYHDLAQLTLTILVAFPPNSLYPLNITCQAFELGPAVPLRSTKKNLSPEKITTPTTPAVYVGIFCADAWPVQWISEIERKSPVELGTLLPDYTN